MRLPHIPWSRIKVPREAGVYAALILVFVFSRGMYFLAGVRFDSPRIFSFMQRLDPVLLESRLLEGLWYLHAPHWDQDDMGCGGGYGGSRAPLPR